MMRAGTGRRVVVVRHFRLLLLALVGCGVFLRVSPRLGVACDMDVSFGL